MTSTIKNAPITLPDFAHTALSELENAGYEAWCVGGFIRDAYRGKRGVDIDIATNAPWRTVEKVFEKRGYSCHETGVAHGTLIVVVDNQPIEITTFRHDGSYLDARHPSEVCFVDSIEEDLGRRDFTMNAIAYHPIRGFFDPYHGREDIDKGLIRTVGDPQKRFSEDALRILRACRFVSQLGFDLDDNTYAAMMTHKNLLMRISTERISKELEGFLLGSFVHDALMKTVDVLAIILPELVSMKDFKQHTPFHIYDVLQHTAYVVQQTPAYSLVRYAAFFHDMGKPAAFFQDEKGIGHFYGHAKVSVLLAQGIMKRLSLSTSFSDEVLTLVKHHDDVIKPTRRAVKHTLIKLEGKVNLFRALCDIKRADALSQAPDCAGRVQAANQLENILEALLRADEAFSLKQLAISGTDVTKAGVAQGPQVGQILADALEAVVNETIPNNRRELMDFVVAWQTKHNTKY